MTNLSQHADRLESALCQDIIDELLDSQKSVRGVLISTIDGFDVAAALRSEHSVKKLAAMTSSLLAIGDVMSVETEIGECTDIVVAANFGKIVILDICVLANRLTLTVWSTGDAVLGEILWAARACRERLQQKLSTN